MTTTMLSFVLLQAQSATQGGGGMFWIMIIAMLAIMYFFMIRPQNKKQKEIQKFRNSLAVGQEIVTIGGVHGSIKSIDETKNTIIVKVATGVEITFERSAIMPKGSAPEQPTK